jgi:biopolymer transport protein ExbD
VDASGSHFWNSERIEDAELFNRLSQAGTQEPQPELHIRGDKAVRYERVAQAMAAAQRSGVRKIGFITEPAQ